MNQTICKHLSGLYAITDAANPDSETTIHHVGLALKGGARLIQFRNKSNNHAQRIETCRVIRQLTKQAGAIFIVNDDIELAQIVKADGVHLGQEDVGLAEARKRLGQNMLIGVSCYNRFDLAEKAEKNGADYIAFGSFFPSRTKPDAAKADIQLLHRARQELKLPVAAIGGITTENGASLVEAGADMLAVVDSIFGQADIELATRRFSALFNINH